MGRNRGPWPDEDTGWGQRTSSSPGLSKHNLKGVTWSRQGASPPPCPPPALLGMGERGRAGNPTSATERAHNAASAHGQPPRFHTPGLSFLSVGALPTKTQGNRHALSSPVKASNPRGPGAQEAMRRQNWRDLFSQLTGACLPPPQSTGHQKGHSQPQKPISSWEVGMGVSRFTAARFHDPSQPSSTHLSQWLPVPYASSRHS